MKLKKFILLAGITVVASSAIAQKKNETSAAVEYINKYQPAMMSGDIEAAKKYLLSAKEFIDLAAAHEETKASVKTLYYKGEIYGSSVMIAMQTGDSNFVLSNFGEDAFEVSIASYRASYKGGSKYRPEIENSINQQLNVIIPMTNSMYDQGNYAEAGALFYYQYQLAAGKDIDDSTNLYNAAICLEKGGSLKEAAEAYEELTKIGYNGASAYAMAGGAYAKLKDFAKAKSILEEGRKKFGTDKDILLEQVKISLAEGDNAGAEAALSEAIAKDPNNKQLHFIIGTIYTELGQNEKAEQELNRALELDPDYLDAQYNLGAHLVTWAGSLKDEANQMKLGDSRYEPMIQQSENTYRRALIPLEKYIAKEPTDASVLMILYQIYYNLGDSEKSAEYKKRYDAAK